MQEEKKSSVNIPGGHNYILSQSIKSHSNSVRCLDVKDDLLISGSFDNTVKMFLFDGQQFDLISSIDILEKQYIYTIKINKIGTQFNFFVGEGTGQLYIFDEHGNVEQQIKVHSNALGSISQISSDLVVTGGWDAKANIVDIQKGVIVETLQGNFSFAVSVLAIPEQDLIFTGSQNKILNIYSISSPKGPPKKSIMNAHDDYIRDLKYVPDIGVLSASNDQTIKLWDFEGQRIQVFNGGHDSFIYGVEYIDFGQYLSVGQDKALKIWKGNAIDSTILHPSSIWQVVVNRQNKDLITACSDGVIRVFTLDEKRQAQEEDLVEFENTSKLAAAQGPQGIPPEELAKMPTVGDLIKRQGKKPNQVCIGRDDKGIPQVYQWNGDSQEWVHIGEAVGSKGTGSEEYQLYYHGDQYFPQGQYDYIFNVQDDMDPSQYQKLPYNEGQSALDSAVLYCDREGISANYYRQIKDWIQNQCTGKPKKSQDPSKNFQNTNSQSNSIVEEIKLKLIPLRDLVIYNTFNVAGLTQKVLEFNALLLTQSHNLALNEKQTVIFNTFAGYLDDQSSYPFQKIDKPYIDVLMKLINWPFKYSLPVLDFIRIYSLHPNCEAQFSGLGAGAEIFYFIYAQVSNPEVNDVVKTVALQALSNFFNQVNICFGIFRNHQTVFDAIESIFKNFNFTNQGLCDAAASLFLNFSIQAFEKQNIHTDLIVQIFQTFIPIMLQEQNAISIFQHQIACGNILVAYKEHTALVKDKLKNYKPYGQDEKVQESYAELKSLLN